MEVQYVPIYLGYAFHVLERSQYCHGLRELNVWRGSLSIFAIMTRNIIHWTDCVDIFRIGHVMTPGYIEL